MHKQCRYCGDYFFTQLDNRLFCSAKCVHQYGEPLSKYHKRSKLTSSAECDLCKMLIPKNIMEVVDWNDEISRVCRPCALALAERCEEASLSVEEILPTTFVD